MKVTTVSVQMSRTISKNYNSFQNSVAATASITDDENQDQVTRHLQRECFRLLVKGNPFDDEDKKENI
jgi:hypothetical protein